MKGKNQAITHPDYSWESSSSSSCGTASPGGDILGCSLLPPPSPAPDDQVKEKKTHTHICHAVVTLPIKSRHVSVCTHLLRRCFFGLRLRTAERPTAASRRRAPKTSAMALVSPPRGSGGRTPSGKKAKTPGCRKARQDKVSLGRRLGFSHAHFLAVGRRDRWVALVRH